MRKGWLRIVPLAAVVLLGTSCVPPSCFDMAYGSRPRDDKALVMLTVYSEPIPNSFGTDLSRRFASGAAMTIYNSGRTTVSLLDLWPRQCPTMTREEVTELSRSWDPFLRQTARSETAIYWMGSRYTARDDWQPDGPLVSLTLVSESGRRIDLLWDGTDLPPELDTPVMSTLETVCSNSRLGRGYLLRNLPARVSGRLKCNGG